MAELREALKRIRDALQDGHECSCRVAAPSRESAVVHLISKYAWRVDEFEDDTVIDPRCPFHGEDGSMVARIG